MQRDPLSPIAPATLRCLLVPIGPIRRKRFLSYVELLSKHATIRLGDVSPNSTTVRSNTAVKGSKTSASATKGPKSQDSVSSGRNAGRPSISDHFSPTGFPDGHVLYDMITELPRPSELSLAPFELHRRPLVVLGIADGDESMAGPGDGLDAYKADAIATLQAVCSGSILQRVLVFDGSSSDEASDGWMHVSPLDELKATTINTVLCDLTSAVFKAMGEWSLSLDASTLETPLAVESKQSSRSRSVSPPTNGTSLATPAVVHAEGFRDGHRISPLDGPGANSNVVTERVQSRQQGRRVIVIGSLYLMAGRWSDALRDLSDGARLARHSHDHAWQAKALDYCLVTILMSAWAGLDFDIPAECYPLGDKTSRKMLPDLGALKSPTSRTTSLQRLLIVLPDWVHYVLHLYTRAASFPSDTIPQLSFSDSALRLARLLAYIQLAHGLTNTCLRALVWNDRPTAGSGENFLTPGEIAATVVRALPQPNTDRGLGLVDHLHIYLGMASVMDLIGFRRQNALLLRQALDRLLPALAKRKDTKPDGSWRLMLQSLAVTYRDWRDLEDDTLRFSLSLCDALPDPPGTVEFSGRLLAFDCPEPGRILHHLYRTAMASGSLAHTWDNELVQGISLVRPTAADLPLRRTKSAHSGPFIYHPQAATAKTTPTILVGSPAVFAVVVRNVLDIDMEIEALSLDADLDTPAVRAVIGPRRQQRVLLTGTATKLGTVSVRGCIAQVRGCESRAFPMPVQRAPTIRLKEMSEGLPNPASLDVAVLADQPRLEVVGLSLSEGALMLREGEQRSFVITLKTTEDLLFFEARCSDDLWTLDAPPEIRAGLSTLTVKATGRIGMTLVEVVLEYGRHVSDVFYTRQIRIPITVTVQPLLRLVRADILSVSAAAARCFAEGSDHVLLVLDLQNVAAQPIAVDVRGASSVKDAIAPSGTSRMVVLVPRLHVEDPDRPLPQRQFVVQDETARASRPAYWYRQALLEKVQATWEVAGHKGVVNLDLQLTPQMLDTLRREAVIVDMTMDGSPGQAVTVPPSMSRSRSQSIVRQPVQVDSIWQVSTDSFVWIKVRIRNAQSKEVRLLLRLVPALRDQPSPIALDLSRKIAVHGLLQRPVGVVAAHGEVSIEVGLVFMCAGVYEIGGWVEELRKAGKGQKTSDSNGRRGHWPVQTCTVMAVDSTAG